MKKLSGGVGCVYAVLLLCVGACADVSEGSTFEVVDSAGVALALSREPDWADGSEWSLPVEPVLELGAQTGPVDVLFSEVVGAARLSDRSIVVCNAAARTLRYYGPEGVHLYSSAGQGDGPDELRRMARCFHRAGEIWVYQAPALPIKIFDERGALLRTVSIPRPGGRVAQLIDVADDGSMLLRQDARRQTLEPGASPLRTTIMRTAPDGGAALDTVGTFDGGLWVRGDVVTFPAAFSPTLAAAFVGKSIVVSWPEISDFMVIDSVGDVVRRVRTTTEPLAVSAADRRAFEDRVLNGPMPAGDTPYQDEGIRRQIVGMMVYPDVFPVHYRMLISIDGLVWLERGDAPRDPLPQVADVYPAPTTWDVFDSEGRWLGGVALPARFDPLEIAGAHVLGVHHDELGVERLRLYDLTKPVR